MSEKGRVDWSEIAIVVVGLAGGLGVGLVRSLYNRDSPEKIAFSTVFAVALFGIIGIAYLLGRWLHGSVSRGRPLPGFPFYVIATLLVAFSFALAIGTIAGVLSLKPGRLGYFEYPLGRFCGASAVVVGGILLFVLRTYVRIVYGALEFAFASPPP